MEKQVSAVEAIRLLATDSVEAFTCVSQPKYLWTRYAQPIWLNTPTPCPPPPEWRRRGGLAVG